MSSNHKPYSHDKVAPTLMGVQPHVYQLAYGATMLKGDGKQETPAPIETGPTTIKFALSPEIGHMIRRVRATEAVMRDDAMEKETGATMT